MKKSNWLIIVTFLIFSLVGCSNGVTIDDMLADYNKNFSTPNTQTDREYKNPDDEDFDPSKMLLENYFVVENGSFVVAGPEGCESYNWKITTTAELGKILKVKMVGNLTQSSREFAFYAPTSGLKVDSYQLTLTIVTKGGKEYSDTCRLVIYKD